jgi:acyl-CoA reductase-like NAD-dependent aldehyde dehydrogenase
MPGVAADAWSGLTLEERAAFMAEARAALRPEADNIRRLLLDAGRRRARAEAVAFRLAQYGEVDEAAVDARVAAQEPLLRQAADGLVRRMLDL